MTAEFEDETFPLLAVQLFVLAATSALVSLPELTRILADPAVDSVSSLVHAASGVPWSQVVWMGLMTTALTLYIEVQALKEVSAPLAALIYTAEPLWGAIFAWIMLDDRFGELGFVGAGVIVVSSLYAQLGGDATEPVPLSTKTTKVE